MKSRIVSLILPILLVAACGSVATPTASATASVSPTPSPSPSATTPVASASTQPSAAVAGTITGRLGYPSDFVPPLTVYAISVSDSSVWFSTDTPRFGNPLSATPPPGPTWPPTGPGTYSISGIKPGTYYVIAYRNDNPDPPQLKSFPGAYTQHTAKCGAYELPTPLPGPCPYDQSLMPVTVIAGQTVSRIDIIDWLFQAGNYPPRPR